MQKKDDSFEKSKKRKFNGMLVVILSIILGAYAFSRTYQKIESKNWPSAQAILLSGSVYERRGKKIDWCLKINYKYTVGENEYISSKISSSLINDEGCASNEIEILNELEIFRKKSGFRVRYDASDPKNAIVFPGKPDVIDYVLNFISILLLFTGIFEIKMSEKDIFNKLRKYFF